MIECIVALLSIAWYCVVSHGAAWYRLVSLGIATHQASLTGLQLGSAWYRNSSSFTKLVSSFLLAADRDKGLDYILMVKLVI